MFFAPLLNSLSHTLHVVHVVVGAQTLYGDVWHHLEEIPIAYENQASGPKCHSKS